MEASAIAKKMIGKTYPDVRPGDTVRVFEHVKEGDKTRIARFEGMIIARKHGNEPGASITVRKISFGVGVERLFPLGSPFIEKIEVIKRSKVRRAKLLFLRKRTGKAATLKGELVPPETGTPEQAEAAEAASPVAETAESGDAEKVTEENINIPEAGVENSGEEAAGDKVAA